MTEKKYYEISVLNGNWENVHKELCEETCDCQYIPDRSVECYDLVDHSENRGRYLLTEAEADGLKNHPDIKYVVLDISKYPELKKVTPEPCEVAVKRQYDETAKAFPNIWTGNFIYAGLEIDPTDPEEPWNTAGEPISSPSDKSSDNKRTSWGLKRIEEGNDSLVDFIGVQSPDYHYLQFYYDVTNRANKTIRFQYGNDNVKIDFLDSVGESSQYDDFYSGPSGTLTYYKPKKIPYKDTDENLTQTSPIYGKASKYYSINLKSVQYEKTGQNVDLIIVDNGVAQYHPEFLDRFSKISGATGENLFQGRSRVRDLILDGPYFLDPQYFNNKPQLKTTKWDGRPTCTRAGAISWWANSSNRSSKFSGIGQISDIASKLTTQPVHGLDDQDSYYEEQVIGGPPAPGHEVPDSSKVNLSDLNAIIGSSFLNHGTSCASVAAGINYGSAIDARIWNLSIKVAGGAGGAIRADGLESDLIKIFHRAKKACSPSDVRYSAGTTENLLLYSPTIRSDSWSSSNDLFYNRIKNLAASYEAQWVADNNKTADGPYNGVTVSGDFEQKVNGVVSNYELLIRQESSVKETQIYITGMHPSLIDSIIRCKDWDTSFSTSSFAKVSYPSSEQELDAANEMFSYGVIGVAGAGNSWHQIYSGDNDRYDNYINFNGDIEYRNRRGQPSDYGGFDEGIGRHKMVMVGAFDSLKILDQTGKNKETIADFSNRGSGIDVFAPGYYVLGASIKTAGNGRIEFDRPDSPDGIPSYWSSLLASKYGEFGDIYFSGTSCACPMTSGIICLYLEEKPNANWLDVQNWIRNSASAPANMYTPYSNPSDKRYWETSKGFGDSANRVLYNPYSSKKYTFSIQNNKTLDFAQAAPESLYSTYGITKKDGINALTKTPEDESVSLSTFLKAVDVIDTFSQTPEAFENAKVVNDGFGGRDNGGNARYGRQFNPYKNLNGFAGGGGGGGGKYGGGGATIGAAGGGGAGYASGVDVKRTEQGSNSQEGYARIWTTENDDLNNTGWGKVGVTNR